jgi:CheY-like chemotaxis protein
MLVEDDKALSEIYGIRLSAEGYDIVSAGDGEEALAVAVREKPDLILSDVMMPKISGFDMLDILRSTPETKNVKVVMMTALSSDEQRKRGESLGADRYLIKSQVGIEDVVNTVHEVLGDRATGPAPAAPAAPVAPPPMPAPTVPVGVPSPTLPDAPQPVAPAPQQPAPEPAVPVQGIPAAPAPITAEPVAVAPAATPAEQEPAYISAAPAEQPVAPAAPVAPPPVPLPGPQLGATEQPVAAPQPVQPEAAATEAISQPVPATEQPIQPVDQSAENPTQ